jgi:uncharacterized membrane protein YfcA
MDVAVLGAVALAGFLLGFGKAGVAGTLGPFVTVLVALTLPADDAIGLLLPMLIVADAFAVAAHWRRWDTGIVVPLVGAAVGGIVVGTLVLSAVSEEVLQRIIAVAMLVFVAVFAGVQRIAIPPERAQRFRYGAGAAAGLSSTLAHIGGPPIVMYLMAAGVAPRVLVGTTVGFFAVINVLKVPGYFLTGLFDAELIRSTLWVWFTIPLGVVLGRMMVDRINRQAFERVTLALLAAGAVVLLVA